MPGSLTPLSSGAGDADGHSWHIGQILGFAVPREGRVAGWETRQNVGSRRLAWCSSWRQGWASVQALHSAFEVWPLPQGLGQSEGGLHLGRKLLRAAPQVEAVLCSRCYRSIVGFLPCLPPF